MSIFFFQAEDGIRDVAVTGVQTCALPICGAEVLLVCSSWVPGEHKTEQWLALNAARAIENSVYVAGVCQAPPVSVGRSVLVDPMGVVEADLGLAAGVRVVEVSLECQWPLGSAHWRPVDMPAGGQ